jgi:hypothetical protein
VDHPVVGAAQEHHVVDGGAAVVDPMPDVMR